MTNTSYYDYFPWNPPSEETFLKAQSLIQGWEKPTAEETKEYMKKIRAWAEKWLNTTEKEKTPEELAYDKDIALLRQREDTARMEAMAEMQKQKTLELKLKLAWIDE